MNAISLLLPCTAGLVMLVAAAGAMASDENSPLKGPASRPLFHPSEETVQTALAEFAGFPKKSAFQGNHVIGDGGLGSAVRMNQHYPGVTSAAEMEKARAAYRESGVVPDAEWVGYWMAKSDEDIFEMISPENPRSLVPNYYEGHPLFKSNFKALIPIWGKRNHFYSPEDGTEWGPGMEVRNPGTGKLVTIEDHGLGWNPPEGFPIRSSFKFVAAYRSYLIRKLIYYPYNGEHHFDGPNYREHGSAIYALAYAYAVTGEQKYADRVLLILATLSRYYPAYTSLDDTGVGWHWYPFRGYLDDHNFENGMIVNMALAYDLVFDGVKGSDKVIAFLNEKPGKENMETPGALAAQIEKNLFSYSWEFVRRAIPGGSGNMLFRQLQTALVLANVFRNDAVIRYVLEGPKNLNHGIIGSFYRDGRFWEDSCTYSWVVHHALADSLSQLAHYRSGKYPQGILLDPAAKATAHALTSMIDEWQVSGRLLGIGDTKVFRTPILKPEAPFQTTWTAHEVGLTLLRLPDSRESGRAALLFHGNAGYGHGHEHQLMLKIYGLGYDFSGDLGYPANFTSPKWIEWTRGTLSHPTVVVNRQSQNVGTTASLGIRAEAPWAVAASAYSNNVYQPGGERAVGGKTPALPPSESGEPAAQPVSTYHRTAVVLQVGEGREVVVDLFRVAGGTCHDLPFHAPSGEEGENFELTGATMGGVLPGTLAGAEVPYGTRGHEGYSYLKEARQGVPEQDRKGFHATWWPERGGAGYRISVPEGFPGEVIIAKGEGEGNPGASPWDRYLLLRHEAKDGSSPVSTLFIAVHEVFAEKPLDFEVVSLPVKASTPEQMAAKVELRFADGTVWTVESALAGAPLEYEARGREKLRVSGPKGVMSVNWSEGGRPPAPFAGKVTEVDYAANEVTLASRHDLSGMKGRIISFNHPTYSKATTFEIASVGRLRQGKWRIGLKQHPILAKARIRQVGSNRKMISMDRVSEKLLGAVTVFDGKVASISDHLLPGRLLYAEISAMSAEDEYQKFRMSKPLPKGVGQEGATMTLYDYGIGDDALLNHVQIISHAEDTTP